MFGCVDWLGIVGTVCEAGCVYVKGRIAGVKCVKNSVRMTQMGCGEEDDEGKKPILE